MHKKGVNKYLFVNKSPQIVCQEAEAPTVSGERKGEIFYIYITNTKKGIKYA
jgi:hypothetical protein